MPRYLVMVQWGAGCICPKGFTFTAMDDQQAMTDGGLERIGLDRKERESKSRKGARPHGILLRVVKDERPEFGSFCSKCGKPVYYPDLVCCGEDIKVVRLRIEGSGPETPYLDLREEG